MECRYCQTWNTEDEHRCTRCGRRLRANTARPAPNTYPISTATAPSLVGLLESVSQGAGLSPGPVEEPVVQRAAYQRALFHEMQRVVEMPAAGRPEAGRSEKAAPRPRVKRAPEGQGRLEFSGALDAPVESMMYCETPVALPVHRLIASAIDTGIILIGLAVFLITFQVAGGEIILNRHTLPLLAGIASVLGFFYHFLFCICGGDTPGMRSARLRLVNFDGHPPDREQRAYRLVGSILSVAAAGLGLIWALVDEESLTWHDHMSKTFPSPM